MSPTLLYDGTCGFCARAARLARRLAPGADVRAWQDADLAALGTTAERADRELLWVRPDGTVDGGAAAVARLLRAAQWPWPLVSRLLAVPPLRWVAGRLYRLVARNRHRLPGGTATCAVPPEH